MALKGFISHGTENMIEISIEVDFFHPISMDEICLEINTSDAPFILDKTTTWDYRYETVISSYTFKRRKDKSFSIEDSIEKALSSLKKEALERLQVKIDQLLESE